MKTEGYSTSRQSARILDKAKIKKQFQLLKQCESLCIRRHAKQEELLQEGVNVALLRQEIGSIDLLLDTLTEEEEIKPDLILEQIMSHIKLIEPKSLFSHKQLQEEEEIYKKKKVELEAVDFFVKKYHQIFAKGAHLLQRSKKKSWLAALFGHHPKVLLSYEIGRIAREGDEDLAALSSLTLKVESNEIRNQLVTLLTEVSSEAKKVWNHALYEEAFHLFYEKSTDLYQKMRSLLDDAEKERIVFHQRKEHWIEEWLSDYHTMDQ